jgi:hypothetical protein
MSEREPDDAVALGSRVGALVFGDRLGLLIFLVSVLGLGLFWRAGLFITDSTTIVRTLDAVAGGSLQIDVVTGDHFSGPGAVVHDGAVYGRNYGQVVLSLPVRWGIDALSRVTEVRIGLVALWHLLAIGLVVQLDRVLDGARRLRSVGSGVVFVSFVGNLVVATSFATVSKSMLALQLFGILCAGAIGVVLYRLVARFHPGRIAWLAGLASTLVLPIGFWAQLPKRHVLTSLLVVWILYAFAGSRSIGGTPGPLGLDRSAYHRASMYALVGLLAWVHAAEAVFVLLGLAVVDVPTAPSNDVRTLAVLVGVFGVSLVPFLVTNGLISGAVLEPPRTLPRADAAVPTADGVLGTDGGSGGGSTGALPGGAVVEKPVGLASQIVSQLSGSLAQLTNPDVVLRTWIRSGSLEGLADGGLPAYRAVNLAVLEVAPVLTGLVAAAVVSLVDAPRAAISSVAPTDAAAVALALAYLLLFTQSLPVHVQVTVRYLLPIYPLGLFLLARQRPVRELMTRDADTAGWSYLAVVLLGSQLILAAVVATGMTVSEAAQLHAGLALVAGGTLGLSIVATRVWIDLRPLAAASLGAAAGLGTSFVLLTGFAYFSFIGQYVLPVSEAVAEVIGRI